MITRQKFLATMIGATTVTSLGSLRRLADALTPQDEKMPMLFVGHGSPMNAIEDNEFTQRWTALGSEIRKPTAVLCISAHWLTRGTFVTAMSAPKTIHDFGGFPKALFDVQYPAPGSPEIAQQTANLVKTTNIGLDHDWGLDHGTWSVVKQMYPKADIPVLQLSIDYHQPAAYHYELAKAFGDLRKKGVLIIGSGNMVHNLGMIDWTKREPNANFGFDWAIEINTKFKELITDGNHQPLINYETLGQAAKNAIPTPDHYYPLLYVLAMQEKQEAVSFFNDTAVMGSLTMTSVKIG